MPKFEIEVDDKGEIIGKAPAEIESIFKRIETTHYGGGLKKGREDAITEAQTTADARIKAERDKWEKENPTQRVKELEQENLTFREGEATLVKRFNETSRQREENHAKEIADKAEAIAKRDRRLGELLKDKIRADALSAGARDESLSELEVILASKMAYDQDFVLYVKGDDDKPLMVQGKPVEPAQFVRSYIEKHAHHRKPVQGQGGGARGGASYSGHTGEYSEAEATARMERGDRSVNAINALFEATRRGKTVDPNAERDYLRKRNAS